MIKRSEFGQGLTYCLGMFLAHELDIHRFNGSEHKYELWFGTASDHLIDFLPEHAPKNLQKRCQRLKDFCLNRRLIFNDEYKPDGEDFMWAVSEARNLLRLIDKKNGIPTIKGDYE